MCHTDGSCPERAAAHVSLCVVSVVRDSSGTQAGQGQDLGQWLVVVFQFGEVGHRTDVSYIITYLWRNGGRTTAFVVGFSHACH